MARLKDAPARAELEGKIEKIRYDMEEKGETLDRIASDVETIKHTLENLHMGGTREGAEKIMTSFESTEEVTKEVFEKKDDELERIQEDNEEFSHELEGRRESSESDLGKISDASARIETEESINELLKAKEGGLEEIDFLKEQIDRAREAKERSETIQERHRSRINTGGGR